MSGPRTRNALLFRLLGALGMVLMLTTLSPRQSTAQQRPAAETAEGRTRGAPDPLDRHLAPPTDEGESLTDLGDGHFALGGADAGVVDASADAALDAADSDAGEVRPAPPLDDASCSISRGADGGLMLALFASGMFLYRRRD